MQPKKNLTVRLDDATREKLEIISDRECRPLANQITVFVRQGIEKYLADNGLYFMQNPEDHSYVLMDPPDIPD